MAVQIVPLIALLHGFRALGALLQVIIRLNTPYINLHQTTFVISNKPLPFVGRNK